MVKATLKTTVDAYDARVSIKSLYEATQMIRRGALTDDVIKASFRVMDKQFNLHVAAQAAARGDLSHVFDWNMVGSQAGRLWQTKLVGRGSNRSVLYAFLPSKKKVPFDPELEGLLRRRHVFKRKAEVFEHGEPVTISPKYAKFLVYINRHNGAGYVEGNGKVFKKNGITFTTRTSNVVNPGGDKFRGKFSAEFVRFWSNPKPIDELAQELGRSTAVQYARAASSRKRMANYKAKLTDPTPEARRRAETAIANLKKQMRGKK